MKKHTRYLYIDMSGGIRGGGGGGVKGGAVLVEVTAVKVWHVNWLPAVPNSILLDRTRST